MSYSKSNGVYEFANQISPDSKGRKFIKRKPIGLVPK